MAKFKRGDKVHVDADIDGERVVDDGVIIDIHKGRKPYLVNLEYSRMGVLLSPDEIYKR